VNLLDNVRGALRKLTTATTPATSADIATMVEKATAALEAARRRLSDLEAKRATVLLEADGKRSAWRAELNDARDAVEDAELLLGELRTRHLAAVEGEAEAARRERYDAARAKADAAVATLRREYPAAARAITAVLKELAEAEAAVDVVNGDLPVGAERLRSPESIVRTKAGRPDQIIADDVVWLWCGEHAIGPLADEKQGLVKPDRDNPRRGTLPLGRGDHLDVVARPYRRTRSVRGTGATILPDLAKEVVLPPLEPGGRPFWQAMVWTSPAAILAEIEKLAAPLPQREPKPPEVVEELHPMRLEDVPADAEPADAG
jgi:hypothetical protein